jgi:hypothetical protein
MATKMILPYEWILENVEEEPMTMASKMILFRGERVFRVGFKKSADSDILFFMAINLSKIGLKVEDVMYRIPGSGTGITPMVKMTKEDIGAEGSLQLFTIKLTEKVLGNCTFAFRICIGGSVYSYSYQLCDRLAKEQFWNAIKNQQNLADVEVIVKDKTFPAHKAILAARSQVFADKFKMVQPGKDGRYQIRIDGVEPSTVENFLYFVYTGEPKGTLANEELLKLANKYGLTNLLYLCQNAEEEITAAQMSKVMEKLSNGVETLNSSKIM